MAFQIGADVVLNGPSAANLASIQKQIQSLGMGTSAVDVKVNPTSQRDVSSLSKEVARLRTELDSVKAAAANAAAASASVGRQATASTSALNNQAMATKRVEAETARAAATSKSYATANRTMSASLSDVNKNLGSHTNYLRKSIEENNKLEKSLTKSSETFSNFGYSVGNTGRRFLAYTAFVGTAVGITRTLTTAVQEGIKFEKEMVRLRQVSSDTPQVISGVAQSVRDLATGLGVSSSALAQAAVVFKQAGVATQELRTHLETLALSDLSPNFESMADTTEAMIAIMRQFNTDAKETQAVVGSIGAVSGAFAAEAGDITSAIQKTGGAFKAAGGDVRELVALFTSVRSTTRESAESIATGLRTIFTRVQRSETVDALKDLNINLRYTREELLRTGKSLNLENQFVGAYEAIKRLNAGLSELRTTDPRYSAIIEELGGYRQVSRVIPLIQQFADSQTALNVAMAGSSSLTIAAEQAQTSLANRITKTKERFLELGGAIVESDGFQALARGALAFADALAALTPLLKTFVPLLTSLAAIKAVSTAIPFATRVGSGLFGKTNFFGQQASRFNAGGRVSGFGTGDVVPAMLEPGEFVMKKDAVQDIGVENLHKWNSRKYARGGFVMPQTFLNRPGGRSLFSSNYKPANVIYNTAQQRMGIDPASFGIDSLMLQRANEVDFKDDGSVATRLGFFDGWETLGAGRAVGLNTDNLINHQAKYPNILKTQGGLLRRTIAHEFGHGLDLKLGERMLGYKEFASSEIPEIKEFMLSILDDDDVTFSRNNYPEWQHSNEGFAESFRNSLMSGNRFRSGTGFQEIVMPLLQKHGLARFSSGGSVGGVGSGDKIPALLEPGEFVMKKAAVDRIGVGRLRQANSGGMRPQPNVRDGVQHMAEGDLARVMQEDPDFIEKTQRSLYKMARGKLKLSEHQAEDVSQSAIVDILEKFDSGFDPSKGDALKYATSGIGFNALRTHQQSMGYVPKKGQRREIAYGGQRAGEDDFDFMKSAADEESITKRGEHFSAPGFTDKSGDFDSLQGSLGGTSSGEITEVDLQRERRQARKQAEMMAAKIGGYASKDQLKILGKSVGPKTMAKLLETNPVLKEEFDAHVGAMVESGDPILKSHRAQFNKVSPGVVPKDFQARPDRARDVSQAAHNAVLDQPTLASGGAGSVPPTVVAAASPAPDDFRRGSNGQLFADKTVRERAAEQEGVVPDGPDPRQRQFAFQDNAGLLGYSPAQQRERRHPRYVGPGETPIALPGPVAPDLRQVQGSIEAQKRYQAEQITMFSKATEERNAREKVQQIVNARPTANERRLMGGIDESVRSDRFAEDVERANAATRDPSLTPTRNQQTAAFVNKESQRFFEGLFQQLDQGVGGRELDRYLRQNGSSPSRSFPSIESRGGLRAANTTAFTLPDRPGPDDPGWWMSHGAQSQAYDVNGQVVGIGPQGPSPLPRTSSDRPDKYDEDAAFDRVASGLSLPPGGGGSGDIPARRRRERNTFGDLVTDRAVEDNDAYLAKVGPLPEELKEKVRQTQIDKNLNNVKEQLIQAETKILRQQHENLRASEAREVAEIRVARAMSQNAAIATDGSGNILGTQASVDGARSQGIAVRGVSRRASRGLRGFLGRGLSRVGGASGALGIGAAIAAPTIAGLVDPGQYSGNAVDSSSFRNRKVVAGGLQGAIAGGTAGAFIGSAVPVVGTAIGAAVGALVGGIGAATAAFQAAAQEIAQVKIGNTLTELANDFGELAKAGSASSGGSELSVRNNIRQFLEQNRSNALEESTSWWSGVDETGFAERRQSGLRQGLSGQLPQMVQFLSTEAEELAKSNLGANAQVLSSQLSRGNAGLNQEIVGLISSIRGVSSSKVLEEFTETIESAQTAERSRLNRLQAQSGEQQQVNNFNRLIMSFQSASDSLNQLRRNADSLADTFYGVTKASEVDLGGEALNQLGRNDRAALNPLRVIGSFGGEQGQRIFRQGAAIDTVSRVLPSVLADIASTSPTDEEDVGIRARGELSRSLGYEIGQAPEELQRVINTVTSTLSQMEPDEIAQSLKTDASQFGLDLLSPLKDPLQAASQQLITQIENNFNEISGRLTQFEGMQNVASQTGQRLSQQQADSYQQRFLFDAQNSGFGNQAASRISLDRLLKPFDDNQRRLTGLGASAGDPQAIGDRLTDVLFDIQATREEQQRAATTGGVEGAKSFQEATEKLAGLQQESVNLQEALGNLADASQRNAIIQERLAQIDNKEQSRRSLGERFLTADPEERFRLNNSLRQVEYLKSNPNAILNLSSQQRGDVFSLLDSMGASGQDQKNQLIDLALGGQDGSLLDKKDLQQRQKLQGQVNQNNTTAESALSALAEFQKTASAEFYNTITQLQERFFTRLEADLVRNKITDTKNELGRVGAERGELDERVKQANFLGRGGINTTAEIQALQNSGSLEALSAGFEQKAAFETKRSSVISSVNDIIKSSTINGGELPFVPAGWGTGSRISDDALGQIRGKLDEFRVPPELQAKIIEDVKDGLFQIHSGKGSVENLDQIISPRLSSTFAGSAEYKDAEESIRTASSPLYSIEGINADRIVNEVRQNGSGNLTEALGEFSGDNSKIEELPRAIHDSNTELNNLRTTFQGLTADLQEITQRPTYKAEGGSIFAPRGTDTVPAMLTPGEFVVNANAASQHRDLLEEINSGATQYLAGGGGVLYARRSSNVGAPHYLRPHGVGQNIDRFAPPKLLRRYPGAVLSDFLQNDEPTGIDLDFSPKTTRRSIDRDQQQNLSNLQSRRLLAFASRLMGRGGFGLMMRQYAANNPRFGDLESQNSSIQRTRQTLGFSKGGSVPGGRGRTTKYLASGGSVPTGGSGGGDSSLAQSASSLSSSMTNFAGASQLLSQTMTSFAGSSNVLAQAINNMPRTISGDFQHTVNVNINGAEIFRTMQPEIQNMIVSETRAVIRKVFKENLPDANVNI